MQIFHKKSRPPPQSYYQRLNYRNYSGSKFRGSRFKVRRGFLLLAISRNMKSASQSAVNRESDNLSSYELSPDL